MVTGKVDEIETQPFWERGGVHQVFRFRMALYIYKPKHVARTVLIAVCCMVYAS